MEDICISMPKDNHSTMNNRIWKSARHPKNEKKKSRFPSMLFYKIRYGGFKRFSIVYNFCFFFLRCDTISHVVSLSFTQNNV